MISTMARSWRPSGSGAARDDRAHCVAQSRANYYWTFLSLSSALNLDYLQSLLPGRLEPQSQKRRQAYRLLRDNRVAAFLRERGYRTVHLQSTWSGTAANPYADEFRECHGGLLRDEYLRALN